MPDVVLVNSNVLFDAVYIVLYCVQRGRSPLHYACMKGHTACVKLLIDSNADINDKDEVCPHTHIASTSTYTSSTGICFVNVCKYIY